MKKLVGTVTNEEKCEIQTLFERRNGLNELPVVAFILAKLELITSTFMVRYRRHAFIGVMVTAAIITPPDLFTLILVTVPMYLLYELCIVIIKRIE